MQKRLGITVQTLRDWDKKEILKPAYLGNGKHRHRYYSEEQLNQILQKRNVKEKVNIGYVRVSANHQKDDLKRQYDLMELYLTKQGKEFKIISDIGSGINYNKKGLKELLKLISTNYRIFKLYRRKSSKKGIEIVFIDEAYTSKTYCTK